MIEIYRKSLIVVDFVAYGGKQQTEFFFDSTYEQASNFIWDKICPTAVVLFAWEYRIDEAIQLKLKKKKLSDEELEKRYKKY